MMSTLKRLYRKLRFGEPVVVVSGLPRSGTSMLMKMLEAGGVPIVTDGLRSIRRSYRRGELEAIAPPGWEVRRIFPNRLVMLYAVDSA